MQHTVSKSAGSRPVTIEVDGEPLGVVVPDAEGFRFDVCLPGARGAVCAADVPNRPRCVSAHTDSSTTSRSRPWRA